MLAQSPDGRIFVTDLFNRTDNKRGAVYILEEFDLTKGSFQKTTPYLIGLRNPNGIAFYTDTAGTHWFYLALTDRLLRFKYSAGESTPGNSPEVLATFPDYGLSYKYGGWHLTRTVAVGTNDKIYVSVGSSCNACEEKEEVRATIVEMDPDGKNQRYFARGLRNAVGLRWVNNQLWATNMGADHLGDRKPADTMHALKEETNYGWPACYAWRGKMYADAKFADDKIDCQQVPAPHASFAAHSSPLGFDYFEKNDAAPELSETFLVALHGSTKKSLNHGYSVSRVHANARVRPDDFITGFIQKGKVWGRPADVLKFGRHGFLVTDDFAGVVYYVTKK